MQLHYTPDFSHFTNAINGAVGQCCTAIIEKFQENNLKKIDFAARGEKINMVFSDGVGTYEERRIKEVEYDDFGDIQIVAEDGSYNEFTEKGGSDYGIIEPVIGEVYRVVAEACHKQDWKDGELNE